MSRREKVAAEWVIGLLIVIAFLTLATGILPPEVNR